MSLLRDMVAEGDKVAARFTARGIHEGAFMGLPPTGKLIAMTGIEVFRIENGKIAELWGEANLFGLMQQLGILPPLARLCKASSSSTWASSFHNYQGREPLPE